MSAADDRCARIELDRHREAYIVVVLDADEAEAIGDALGPRDAASRELYELATQARAINGATS